MGVATLRNRVTSTARNLVFPSRGATLVLHTQVRTAAAQRRTTEGAQIHARGQAAKWLQDRAIFRQERDGCFPGHWRRDELKRRGDCQSPLHLVPGRSCCGGL